MLTPEEMLDLRARVLAGERPSLETCKAIVERMRLGRAAAEAGRSAKRSSRKKVMSDDELFASIDSLIAGDGAAEAEGEEEGK